MVLWLWKLEVVEYRDDLSWSYLSRTETVATANDQWTVLYIVECRLNVEVKWLTLCTWLLGTVKYGNLLN